METIELDPESTRLASVSRERSTRGAAYIVWCRHGRFVFLSQSLPRVAAAMNTHAASSFDKVSHQTLYQCVRGRVKSAVVKGTFGCSSVGVEMAVTEMNRKLSECAILTDSPRCYALVSLSPPPSSPTGNIRHRPAVSGGPTRVPTTANERAGVVDERTAQNVVANETVNGKHNMALKEQMLQPNATRMGAASRGVVHGNMVTGWNSILPKQNTAAAHWPHADSRNCAAR